MKHDEAILTVSEGMSNLVNFPLQKAAILKKLAIQVEVIPPIGNIEIFNTVIRYKLCIAKCSLVFSRVPCFSNLMSMYNNL